MYLISGKLSLYLSGSCFSFALLFCSMESLKLGFGFFFFHFFFWMPMVAANTDSLLSPMGVNYDVAALMAVKSKMKDELHVLDGWDIYSVDPCTWNMVACSAEGFVVSPEMANMGLSGTLSSSIGNLSHLRTVLLQNNQLSGSIPPDIGKLPELQTLGISNNQFDGEISGSLGYLTHLSYIFSGDSVETSCLVRFLELLLISQVFRTWIYHLIISVVPLQKYERKATGPIFRSSFGVFLLGAAVLYISEILEQEI